MASQRVLLASVALVPLVGITVPGTAVSGDAYPSFDIDRPGVRTTLEVTGEVRGLYVTDGGQVTGHVGRVDVLESDGVDYRFPLGLKSTRRVVTRVVVNPGQTRAYRYMP